MDALKDPDHDREWTMTPSGRPFFAFAPRLQDFRIEDLAHMLAAQNRFRGATREPYNVAHHSVLSSLYMGWEWATTPDTEGLTAEEFEAYGLVHDGAEFVLGDTPRPQKRCIEFAPVVAAEKRLQAFIYRAVGLDPDREPKALKTVDRRLLRTEQLHLMPPPAHGEIRDDVPVYVMAEGELVPWGWRESRDRFLERFAVLVQRGVLRYPQEAL